MQVTVNPKAFLNLKIRRLWQYRGKNSYRETLSKISFTLYEFPVTTDSKEEKFIVFELISKLWLNTSALAGFSSSCYLL